MSGCIGVLNAGSSSIKFALYSASGDVDLLFRGQIEGIGVSPHLNVKDAKGGAVIERAWPAHGFNHEAAAREYLPRRQASSLAPRSRGSDTGSSMAG